MRVVLQQDFFSQISPLFRKATCSCKSKTVFVYFKALRVIGVWPLESIRRGTLLCGVLTRLNRFDMDIVRIGCKWCDDDYEKGVAGVKSDMVGHFDGLCLDCMNKERPKTDDPDDSDYCPHHEDRKWDEGCRVKHGNPT